MRRPSRARLTVPKDGAVMLIAIAIVTTACDVAQPRVGVARSTGERAAGRAYDGAPPTIPHEVGSGVCVACHDADGADIAGIGVAPASPHEPTTADGVMRRCRQCHVPQLGRTVWVASRFSGLPQGPWRGRRASATAPPLMPHALQMRGQCLACHAGPGSRAEIRTTHPERTRCRQCHVPEGSSAP